MEKKNIILIAILIGLVIFGVVQAMQISDIKAKVTGYATSGNADGSGSNPASQNNQPSQPVMVGGC